MELKIDLTTYKMWLVPKKKYYISMMVFEVSQSMMNWIIRSTWVPLVVISYYKETPLLVTKERFCLTSAYYRIFDLMEGMALACQGLDDDDLPFC